MPLSPYYLGPRFALLPGQRNAVRLSELVLGNKKIPVLGPQNLASPAEFASTSCLSVRLVRRQRDRHARGQATDSLGPRTVRASRDAVRSLQLPDAGDGVARRGYRGGRNNAELLAPEPPNQVSVERVCGPENPPRQ